MSEQELTRAILQALQSSGVWCWRTNSGALVAGKGASRRFIVMAPAGTPDILGVTDGGHMFGLEVKLAKTKQSASQIAWEKQAAANGVGYRVVRSIREALAAVEEWRKSDARRTQNSSLETQTI